LDALGAVPFEIGEVGEDGVDLLRFRSFLIGWRFINGTPQVELTTVSPLYRGKIPSSAARLHRSLCVPTNSDVDESEFR